MPAYIRSGLALAALVPTIAGCGSVPGAAAASDGGAIGAGVDAKSNGGSSTDGRTGTGAGSSSDASPGTDAGSLADSGPPDSGDASADAALPPYKGVANSACNDLVTLGTTWYYDWDLTPPCSTPQFVPMVWGHTGAEQTQAGIASEIAGLVTAGYGIVLGFNEPDSPSPQSNIPEATAISLWPAFNNPSVLVGSPATAANTAGQAWFTSFMSDVNADTTGQLRIDFIAAHWYGWNAGSCDAEAANLESYLKYLEGIAGNRPIWLTEWGCLNESNPDEATVQAFFSGAIAMFANHPRLVRYAWYPWETNNELVTTTDTLTSLGTVFAAAPAYK